MGTTNGKAEWAGDGTHPVPLMCESEELESKSSASSNTNEDGLGLLRTYQHVHTVEMQTQTSTIHCYVSFVNHNGIRFMGMTPTPGSRNSTVCVFKVSACLGWITRNLMEWGHEWKVKAGHLRNNRGPFQESRWMTDTAINTSEVSTFTCSWCRK